MPFPISQPVPMIEDLVKGDSDSVHVPLPNDKKMRLSTEYGDDGCVNQFNQRFAVPSLPFKHVLETVKDRLLDWTVELEKRGIIGEDMAFDDKEKQAAQGNTFNIQNLYGVLGNVTGSSVTGSSVQIYNYSAIHQRLKDCGVPKEERDELETIMDDLSEAKPPAKPGLLQKGKAWIEKNQSFLGATANIVRKALGFDLEKD